MVDVFGKARIQHAKTGKIYDIDRNDLEFETNGTDDRGMGMEIEHTAIFDHNQLGRLTWTVWEHPVGAFNYNDYDVRHHKLLEDFSFEIDNEEGRQDRIDELVTWFKENYEDPVNRLPNDSKEGGYQWIYGGPCYASEELQDNFQDESEEIIERAVEEIESDGIEEWSPIPHPRDFDTKDMFPEHDLKDINDRLNTLIDNAPKSTTAPAFALGDDGIFYITEPPDSQPVDNQNNSPKGLRTTIDKLLESLKGSNGHQDLIPIIEDYKEVILGDKISISDLHCHGIILGNMAHAIKNGIEAKEEPPLPLKTETYLNSALDLHHTYMMLDEKGQRLMNAGDYHKSAEQIEGLKDAIGQLSNIITESRDLLDEGIRKYVFNVLKGMGQGNYPERSNQNIANTLTNLISSVLIVAGTNAAIEIIGSAVATSVPAMAASALGTEAINAVGFFLMNISPSLLILAAPLAGELSWLASAAHLLERIRRAIRRD